MNKLVNFDTNNEESMLSLMDEYKQYSSPLYGIDIKGRELTAKVSYDNIIISTLLGDGWVKKECYHRDGTLDVSYEPNGIIQPPSKGV